MDVRIGGGPDTIQQYLREHLIDELNIAIAPVLLGRGEALFEAVDLRAQVYECVEFVAPKLRLQDMIEQNYIECAIATISGAPCIGCGKRASLAEHDHIWGAAVRLAVQNRDDAFIGHADWGHAHPLSLHFNEHMRRGRTSILVGVQVIIVMVDGVALFNLCRRVVRHHALRQITRLYWYFGKDVRIASVGAGALLL